MNEKLKILLLSALLGLLCCSSVQAQEIKAIEVQGSRKIEKDAILAKIGSRPGEMLSKEKIRQDIQDIFSLGFFYDLKVDSEPTEGGVKLVYRVVERPTVSEIVFEGNEELKTEDLLETSQLKSFEILDLSHIRTAKDRILKSYEDKGFYLAKITETVTDISPGETVKLTFKVVENEKVKVQKITFLGNNKVAENFLKDRLETKEGGFFSFFSGSGSFKQDAFDRDVQRLRFLYFNEGYVQVKIDRPILTVTPDRRSIYITFRIDEGEQFNVGDVEFSGDLLYSRDELFATTVIEENKVFSYEVLQKDLGELQAKYGDLGYAFANVIPRTRINEKERKVDVVFEFDKGQKVFFGQITVVGNSKTRDKVVRRELRIKEGELYNETRKRQSVERIQRLGFFDEVNFKQSTDPATPDVLQLDIVVKERNTGSIQIGAGYGSASGLSLQGKVDQANFLGKGQKLGASVALSDGQSTYSLSFTEPYFRDTEWSLGYDLYRDSSNRYEYTQTSTAGALRFGHPIGEDVNASVSYKLEKTELGTVTDSAGVVITDTTLFPFETVQGVASSVTGRLEYDTRNDRFTPSKGIYTFTQLEYAGIGGDLNYTVSQNSYRYFKKIFWDVVWRNNLNYSFITSHNVNREAPFNRLFLLGGSNSLRGFRWGKVGKTRFSQSRFNDSRFVTAFPDPNERRLQAEIPYGGTKQLLYQMEFEFPLIAEAGIKGVTFFDVGQAEDEITSDNFYSGMGFGFRWFSPIGPLRFEWGFPIRKSEKSPDSTVFEFMIGPPF